ncbi:hypothetical protein ebA5693 [Aromatoleum aromaticum EbN1]|uniref:Uncharacterized protein n=1 Tax=Aromatoleum aromaticum (strain DSM 19018 / LMG 30748 / EbN1) TaxID=76114 RepID=Q5P004_AROAE|nr:hypothetical protein ebA5693 [Aromatoleum aromaticum EbN1]
MWKVRSALGGRGAAARVYISGVCNWGAAEPVGSVGDRLRSRRSSTCASPCPAPPLLAVRSWRRTLATAAATRTADVRMSEFGDSASAGTAGRPTSPD